MKMRIEVGGWSISVELLCSVMLVWHLTRSRVCILRVHSVIFTLICLEEKCQWRYFSFFVRYIPLKPSKSISKCTLFIFKIITKFYYIYYLLVCDLFWQCACRAFLNKHFPNNKIYQMLQANYIIYQHISSADWIKNYWRYKTIIIIILFNIGIHVKN